MQAKFDKILVPIADELIAEDQQSTHPVRRLLRQRDVPRGGARPGHQEHDRRQGHRAGRAQGAGRRAGGGQGGRPRTLHGHPPARAEGDDGRQVWTTATSPFLPASSARSGSAPRARTAGPMRRSSPSSRSRAPSPATPLPAGTGWTFPGCGRRWTRSPGGSSASRAMATTRAPSASWTSDGHLPRAAEGPRPAGHQRHPGGHRLRARPSRPGTGELIVARRPSGPEVIDVQVVRPPLWRRLLPPLVLLAILAAGVLYFALHSRIMRTPHAVAKATNVRSHVSRYGDSLEVEVGWRLKTDMDEVVPESVRVEVGLSDNEQVAVSTTPVDRHLDTLRLSSPEPGQTASGYSCVSGIHRGRITKESCTPWQFVLPSAEQVPERRATRRRTPASRSGRSARKGRKCSASWCSRPDCRSIRTPTGAAPPGSGTIPPARCGSRSTRRPSPTASGPNGKPTVAQFCAFAIMQDGRRLKSANSTDNPYCDRLFKDWSAERVS